jgi:hypothetical protein
MNAPTITPEFLVNFTAALKQFSDQGYILQTVPADAVEVGDYLISYPCEFATPESTERTRNVKVDRVVATGGEQGSGPNPSRQTIALEGNSKVQQYADNPDLLIVRKREVL